MKKILAALLFPVLQALNQSVSSSWTIHLYEIFGSHMWNIEEEREQKKKLKCESDVKRKPLKTASKNQGKKLRKVKSRCCWKDKIEKKNRPGMVAHTYNLSTLEGLAGWITRSGVQDQPGQDGETPSLLKIQKLAEHGREQARSPSLLGAAVAAPASAVDPSISALSVALKVPPYPYSLGNACSCSRCLASSRSQHQLQSWSKVEAEPKHCHDLA
ncbi:Zinc finger protein 714, partial [Plecturocebus cupreus]